ncbi:MAG TPA: hypothetical protein PKI19_04730 [Elusimicrobiales bacterium]|nr:hypothetical protein [Elusimicrobiales bacterium]
MGPKSVLKKIERAASAESPGFAAAARLAAVFILVLAGVCLYLLKR